MQRCVAVWYRIVFSPLSANPPWNIPAEDVLEMLMFFKLFLKSATYQF